jgi:hypothetical protein
LRNIYEPEHQADLFLGAKVAASSSDICLANSVMGESISVSRFNPRLRNISGASSEFNAGAGPPINLDDIPVSIRGDSPLADLGHVKEENRSLPNPPVAPGPKTALNPGNADNPYPPPE